MDMNDKKGQLNLGGILTVVIGIILILSVAVPVTQDQVTEANLSGTDATVANLYVTFFVIGGLLLVAGLFAVFRR